MKRIKRISNINIIQTQKGQSLVELAISLLALILLLGGAVDIGGIFLSFISIRDAAEEGALYGSIMPDDPDGIINSVKYSAKNPAFVDLANDTDISYTLDPNHCAGSAIKVEVKFEYKTIMPWMQIILSDTVPLNAVVINTIMSPVCPIS